MGVNWIYRCVADHKQMFVVLGGGNYSLAQAQQSQPPTPPPIISATGYLVGRILVVKSATTASQIDNTSDTTFTAGLTSDHNSLTNLQGGTANEEYHLTSAEYTGTGTGVFVRTTSPTLVTPILGTPTS